MNLLFDIPNAFHKSYFAAKAIYGDKLNGNLLKDKFLIDFSYTIRFFSKYNRIDKIICCFDDETNFRTSIYEKYKANRIKDKEKFFYDILEYTYNYLSKIGFVVSRIQGLEADDMIGLHIREINNGIEKIFVRNCIISNDEDVRQLLSENTFVYNNLSQAKKFYFIQGFESNMNIDDLQAKWVYEDPVWILFKKIVLGCDGDNVPKLIVGRVGEKTLKKKIYDKINFSKEASVQELASTEEMILRNFKGNESIQLADLHLNMRLVQLGNLAVYNFKDYERASQHITSAEYKYKGNFDFE